MSLEIIIIDALGIVFFFVAAFFSYQNHERMKDASNIWLYFATSSVTAILWAASLIAASLFQIPDIIESTLFFAVVFLFSLVAMGSLFDFVKLQGKLDQ